MARKYTKVEWLAETIAIRKANGETNREIAESYGLTLEQVKNLVKRQNRKSRLVAAGYVPRPKGRPPQKPENAETRQKAELKQLHMQVELLRNFLSETGRR